MKSTKKFLKQITTNVDDRVDQEIHYDPESGKIEVFHYLNLEPGEDVLLQKIEKEVEYTWKNKNLKATMNDAFWENHADEILKEGAEKDAKNMFRLSPNFWKEIKKSIPGKAADYMKKLKGSGKDMLEGDHGDVFYYENPKGEKLMLLKGDKLRLVLNLIRANQYITKFTYLVKSGGEKYPRAKKFPDRGTCYPLSFLPHHIEVVVNTKK
jgi:hypothetical protein